MLATCFCIIDITNFIIKFQIFFVRFIVAVKVKQRERKMWW